MIFVIIVVFAIIMMVMGCVAKFRVESLGFRFLFVEIIFGFKFLVFETRFVFRFLFWEIIFGFKFLVFETRFGFIISYFCTLYAF